MIQLSKMQNTFIREAHHRYNFKVGAVRSGKSFVDLAYMIPSRITEVSGQRGLNVILGVSRDTIERNVLQPMREIYTHLNVSTINPTTNIAYIGGEPCYCLGAEKVSQVAKIQGASIKYCYGDEVAKWNKEVFTMLQSRLDKPYSCMDGALNPESPTHWLKEFMDKPNIDMYAQHYTIFDNPFLPKEYVESLCNEYEGTVYYGRYIQGEWTLAEGLIYPNYQKCIAEPPKEEKPQAYVLSIDYGTMNAFSCGLWAKFGNYWHRIDEYYYSGRDTGIQKTDGEYLKDITNMIAEYPIKEVQYEKVKTIIDPSAASMIALLRKSGLFKVIEAYNAVLDGIRETNTAMVNDLIKISPKCKNWIKEVQGYTWDDKADEDKPVKVNDHAMDDTRYFVKTMKINKPKPKYVPLYM